MNPFAYGIHMFIEFVVYHLTYYSVVAENYIYN